MNLFHSTLSLYCLSACISYSVVPTRIRTRRTPSIHLYLDPQTRLYASSVRSKAFLGYLLSDILITCTYHFTLLFSMVFNNTSTLSSALTVIFYILSFLVTPFIVLRARMLAARSFDSILVVRNQHSLPYIIGGFNIVL